MLLEKSWRSVAYLGFRERRKRKVGNFKRTVGSIATSVFACTYQVSRMILLLVLASLAHTSGFFVMIYSWHGGFPGLTMVFPSLSISWMTMVLWVYLVFLISAHDPYGCGYIY